MTDEPVPAKRSGWGESSSNEPNTMAIESIQPMNTDNQTVSMIPDLEQMAEEKNFMEVAEAPRVQESRVQTLSELDKDVLFQVPENSEVDLTQLKSVLVPYQQLIEKDEGWVPDRTFLNVLSEISSEYEANRKKEAQQQKINSAKS